jgi:hypothetical protein
VAVNRGQVDAFRKANCPVALPCPACAGVANPDIGAECVSSRCQLFDVKTTPAFSACMTPADCVLRLGLDCCECGSMGGWVSVSHAGEKALSQAVCAPNTACAECAPVPPKDDLPQCSAGFCNISVLLL